jgi:hypothetical protein
MGLVATLYVRNLPSELYDDVKRWAEESGRSVNAEILALLEREAERRRGDWFEGLLALRDRINLSSEAAALAVASIRAHRDAGFDN